MRADGAGGAAPAARAARLPRDIWTKKKGLAALALALAGAMAAAAPAGAGDFACAFTVECVDAECAGTRYGGALWADAARGVGRWSDAAGDTDLAVAAHGDALMARTAQAAGGAQHLLSVAGDGAARFTTHITDGPLAITYIGRCEEAR